MTYYTNEKQHVNSVNDSATPTNAKTIAAAKRVAERRRGVCGYVVTVEYSDGEVIAHKKDGGEWVDRFEKKTTTEMTPNLPTSVHYTR